MRRLGKSWAAGGRTVPAAIVLAAAALLAAGPAEARTLKEAVETTLAKHPLLQRDKAFSRGAKDGIDQANSGFLPTVDLESEAGYEYTTSPSTRTRVTRTPGEDPAGVSRFRQDNSVTFRQMAFDGFLTSNTVGSAREDYAGSKDVVQATGEQLGLRTVQLYLDVLRTQEFVDYAEKNVAELSSITDQIRQLARAGRGTGSDVDQAESRLALGRSNLEQRKGELRNAIARYSEVVGELPRDLTNPGVPNWRRPRDEDEAVRMAVERNPSAQATAANYRARQYDYKAADAPFYPRLDVELLGSTGRDLDGAKGRDSDAIARMRMRYNVFNGFGDVARRGRAGEQANAAQQDDLEQRRQIREDVRVAFRTLATADERIIPLRLHTETAEKVLKGYRQQFELGRRSLLDLLDAQNELFQSQISRTDGEYLIVLSHYQLLFTMGAVLETVGVPVAMNGNGNGKPKGGAN